jgi:acetyl esterase/lipase
VTYGSDALQYADLHVAAGVTRGTVILIHGGFWRWQARYFDGPTPMAHELASLGWNVWQIEYRSVGSGGGWPTTLDDVGSAIDRLAGIRDDGLQLGQVITAGHSAGGHLAVWSLSRESAVPLAGAVSLAGVLDLRLAEEHDLGDGAVINFLGGSSAEYPERFEIADPAEHPIADSRVRIVHGIDDDVVPMSQSLSYVDSARVAGQDAKLTPVRGDHGVVIDVNHESWPVTLGFVGELTA